MMVMMMVMMMMMMVVVVVMMMMMVMVVAGQETMKRFAEPVLEKLDWGGRDEPTVLALAKKYRMTGKAEAVEKALENTQTFDEVEAAVQASDSRAGTVTDRRGDYRGCGTMSEHGLSMREGRGSH
jgi:biopolymer transport protein ExbB/TolQ